MNIEWPKKGRLQQGMIFSSCLVPGYDTCNGWGLVITARCDLANEKVPVLNYLPVVRFEDWIERDGRDVVFGRALAEEDGNVAKLLKDLDAPDSILLGTELPLVLEALLGALGDKGKKPFQSRCNKASARYREFAKDGCPSIAWLRAEFPRIYVSVVKEFMTHRLSGYYFLPRLEPDEAPGCYVVLLRQIGAMPSSIAWKIPAGIALAEARDGLKGSESYLRYGSSEEVAMPLGVLPSPHIEHLMQTFSYLLSRIGLPNTDSTHINRYASAEV